MGQNAKKISLIAIILIQTLITKNYNNFMTYTNIITKILDI